MNSIVYLIILEEKTLPIPPTREMKVADEAIDTTTAFEPMPVRECQHHQEDQVQKQENLNSDIDSKKNLDTSHNVIDNSISL
jgi:hypothetical protein